MPSWGPISRRKLIRALRRAGFAGPFTGAEHQIMMRGELRIRVLNPHGAEIGKNLLSEILKQAGISRRQWERL